MQSESESCSVVPESLHHVKCWAGWITSWNQDCEQKYQQFQMCRWYHSNGRNEEELWSLLLKVKEESEKAGLKLNRKTNNIMPSGPITSCKEMGTKSKQWDFIFLGSKITVDGDRSHESKRCLLPGRKAMTNLDNVLKDRDITLLTNVCLVKAVIFPVLMYGCESWTIKKAEEMMLSNCGTGENSRESLGQQADPTSQS